MPGPDRAEEMRLRYLYRDLVLRGRAALPRATAVKLVGPDCAYHLYRSHEGRRESGRRVDRQRAFRDVK